MANAIPRPARLLLGLGAALLSTTAPTRAAAQPPAAAEAAVPQPTDEAEARDSPRAAVRAYLDLARQGRFDEAARFLALDAPGAGRGPELARRLKAVLDRNLWVDMDAVSPFPGGDPDDGLPPGTDELGRWSPGAGRPEAVVRLVRVAADTPPGWVFSAATVGQIDAWYALLPQRWLREVLPAVAFRVGPRELLWWQWLALPFVALAAWGLGRLLGRLTRRGLARAARRTQATWDDHLLDRIGPPLTFIWAQAAAFAALSTLGLYAPAQALLHSVLGAGLVLGLFWALWRGTDVFGAALRAAPWAQGNPSAQSLLDLAVRGGKVGVFALGLVAAIGQLGFPVASLLAGLGIGGIALALAAQKTVENLFGSLSLGIDQPFHVGDFVKIEEFVGTVEAIGLRSTRFRTLDRTLISIPNGRLADMRLESYTARDRMRLACTIGLLYATTAAQMRSVLEGFERVLRSHPHIWPDAMVVRFKEFGASSLDVEIMAWFQTSVFSEFQLYRQQVLLQFMEVVEHAGTGFAFPTRTVHLVREPGEPAR